MARNLNDTQLSILAAAAARDDLNVLPLPDTLRAPAHIVTKTVKALIDTGLIAEVPAEPDAAVWRQDDEGAKFALVMTPAGLAAIGIELAGAPAPTLPNEPKAGGNQRAESTKAATRAKRVPPASTAETGGKASKQAVVIALLQRQQGATIAEMMAATGWQTHSVRGFMSGALKKRLGLEVISEKDKTGERRYYVGPIKSAKD